MPNRYIYDLTFEDHHMEEDRQCTNDLKRVQIDYYNMKYLILEKIYDTLCEMDEHEIKKTIMRSDIISRL